MDHPWQLLTGFFTPEEAQELFVRLESEIPWVRDSITLFGKTHALPRRHRWFADGGLTYTWSGITMQPAPWTPTLLAVRERLHQRLGIDFPAVLANLYRDGHDTMGWHSDDEPELGAEPRIASVSLGSVRDFVVRRKDKSDRRVLPLPSGSVLLMAGSMQREWEHSLPRRKRVRGARINLTFREVAG